MTADNDSLWNCRHHLWQWPSSVVNQLGRSVSSVTSNGHTGFSIPLPWRSRLPECDLGLEFGSLRSTERNLIPVLPDGENRKIIIWSLVMTQYQRVTDGWTRRSQLHSAFRFYSFYYVNKATRARMSRQLLVVLILCVWNLMSCAR